MTEHHRDLTRDDRHLISRINEKGGPVVNNVVVTAIRRHCETTHEGNDDEEDAHLYAAICGELTVHDVVVTPQGTFHIIGDPQAAGGTLYDIEYGNKDN